ncbi:MAG: rhomboid family intramembrane serine protease [Chloroflexota bacterium]
MSLNPDPYPAGPYDAPPRPPAVRLRPPSSEALVTYIILGLTVIVYLLQAGAQLTIGYDLPVDMGGKVNSAIRAGQLWRLITPVLLHGSILHIGFNMYALVVIGTSLEQRMGHARFLILYLLAGFSGNVVSFLLTPNVSVGASTSIFGLLAAEGVFLFQNRALLGQRGQSALSNVIGLAVINLLIGLQPGIDNWGHIGGLLGGLLFMWIGGPRWRVEGMYPYLQIRDERGIREAILGAALVLLIFGALAMIGMWRPFVQ